MTILNTLQKLESNQLAPKQTRFIFHTKFEQPPQFKNQLLPQRIPSVQKELNEHIHDTF
jgi:hypothetical protein